MTNIAALGYEIDSSQARTAARDLDRMNAAAARAAGGANSLAQASSRLLRDERGRFMSAAQSVEKYGAEIDQLRMKYNPIYAASKRFETSQGEIRRALELGAISTAQAEAALENLQMQYLSTGDAANTAAGQMGRFGVQANVGSVFAQLNDIGVMMAAGQSPFMLAIQQGTQLNQVWGNMGAQGRTIGGVFGMLRAGLMQFLNPMGLLTIAAIAGGAALFQWGMSLIGAGEEVDEFGDRLTAVQDIQSGVREAQDILAMSTYELGEEYGTAAGRVRQFAIGQSELALGELTRQLMDQVGALGEVTAAYSNVTRVVSEFGESQDFSEALRAIREDFGATTEQANRLIVLFGELDNSATFEGQQVALFNILTYLRQQGISLARIPPELNEAFRSMLNLSNETDRARKLMNDLEDAANGVSSAVSRIPMDQYQMFLGLQAGYQSMADAPDTPVEHNTGRGRSGGGGANPMQFEHNTGRGRSGGGGANPMQSRLDSLLQSLQTEQEAVEAWYAESQETLAWALENERLTLQEHADARLDIERLYQEQLAALQTDGETSRLDQMSNFFGELNDLAGGGYDGLLRAQRAFAAASALVNTYTAASQALADPSLPFFAKFAAVAKVLAAGFGLVNAIKGGNKTGATGGAATAGVTQSAPDRRVIIDVQGPDWVKSMIDPIIRQLQDATKDGSKVVLA